jgi:hypothetical protein
MLAGQNHLSSGLVSPIYHGVFEISWSAATHRCAATQAGVDGVLTDCSELQDVDDRKLSRNRETRSN